MVGWAKTTLGELCKFENGDRGKNYPGRKAFVPSGIPFINAGHLGDGEIDWQGMDFIPRNRFDLLGNGKVQKRDLLFCLRGSLGKFGVVDQDVEGAIASSLVIVRPGAYLDCDFLAAYFRSTLCTEMISKYANGAAQPNLSAKSLKEFEIPLPPLPEQKRIVAILDEAFAGIDAAVANTEKNLANARELFESYLNGIFAEAYSTGEIVPLSELATDITDGDHMPPPKSEMGVSFITIRNINKSTRKIDFSDTFKVSREYFENLKANKRPKKSDVLYTVTGSFGIPVIVENDTEFCFQRHIGLIRPKSNIGSRWLNYLLLSPQVFQQANDGATGTAQKTVSLKVLRSFNVPVVPEHDQSIVVSKLDTLSSETQRLKTIYQQKLTALAELKQSILQKAFAGDLTTLPEKTLKAVVV